MKKYEYDIMQLLNQIFKQNPGMELKKLKLENFKIVIEVDYLDDKETKAK